MARKVYLAQVNRQFGPNTFLPYSVALLQAYVQAQDDLAWAYTFPEMLFLREPPETVAKRWKGVDVLGLSCYIWNWEYNLALARAVRRANPDCLIVLGGPHVPSDPAYSGFFTPPTDRYVDLLVHHEGEATFAEILRERLKGRRAHYANIHGVSTWTGTAAPRARLKHPGGIPSPYLTGILDPLLDGHPDFDFHATSETHRGCPWRCSFCDWGVAALTQVHCFPAGRVKAEYDWMADHEIELVYNADANYLLFPRDEALTDYLIGLKHRRGWPKQIRAAWTKNASDKQHAAVTKLHAAGMDKGITLSLQSLHPPTLRAIQRRNIRFDNFEDLVSRYQEAGVPVYTELILGLPQETYASFAAGLDEVLAAGLQDGLNIYMCLVLPNSEMGDPDYQDRYGIEAVRAPLLQHHSSPSDDPHIEYADLVIATSSMPREALVRAYELSWAVQVLHGMGLLRHTASWAYEDYSSYSTFYVWLLDASREHDTALGRAYRTMRAHLDRGLEGQVWGRTDPRYGDVIWPLEEASFLDIVSGDLSGFYAEVGAVTGAPPEVLLADSTGLRTPEEYTDLETYAREVVWYGRKGGKFRKG